MRLGAWLACGGFLLASLLHLPWLDTLEPRWAVLMALGAFGIISVTGLPRRSWPFLLLLAYAALSISWTSDPGEGAIWLARMTAVFGVFLLFNRVSLKWLPDAAIVANIAALCMLPVWPISWGGFGNQNWIAEWVILTAPFCCLRWYGIPVALAATFYMIFGNSTFSEFAGLMAFLLLFLMRRGWWPVAVLIVGGAFAIVILEPGWLGRDLMMSFKDRFELLINTSALWFEAPVFGHGLGSFNYEYPHLQEHHISALPGIFDVPWPEHKSRLALPGVFAGAAHNEVLQCLVELGIVGTLLAAAAILRLYLPSRRSSGRLTTASLYSFHAFAAYSLIAFPMQNPQSVLFFALGLAIFSRGERAGDSVSFWWLAPSWLSQSVISAQKFSCRPRRRRRTRSPRYS